MRYTALYLTFNMAFISPAFLWALGFLSIPVIIHLFNFRRYKTVYFSDIRFLKEVKQQTDRTRSLKHWLVLAARLLALAMLVMAFAQPFIPHVKAAVAKTSNVISIYIDNSFSLNNTVEDVNLLKQGKEKAKEIVRAYGDADKFQLITNDFEGRDQKLGGKDEVLNLIDEVKFSPRFKTLNDIAARQTQLLHTWNKAQTYSFIISDFQSNMLTGSAGSMLPYDTSTRVYALPLKGTRIHNVYIDSAWLDVPQVLLQQPSRLFVRLRNTGDMDARDIPLQLKLDGLIKAVKKVNISSNGTLIDTVGFTASKAGYIKAELSITDYPITFDDTYYLTFDALDHLPVLHAYDGNANAYIQAIFDRPLFNYTALNINSLNYSALNKYSCVVFTDASSISSGLSGVLQKYLESGGRVIVFPPVKGAAAGYNAFFEQVGASAYGEGLSQKREAATINRKDNIFKKVFAHTDDNMRLPVATLSYKIDKQTRALQEDLITFKDGGPFVSKYKVGKGLLYLSAVPCVKEAGDLVNNPLFAPMVFNMSIMGNTFKPLAYTIGIDNFIEWAGISQGDVQIHLKKDKIDLIPMQRSAANELVITTGKELNEAGLYDIVNPGNPAPVGALAFNYDRRESLLKFATKEDIANLHIKHLTILDNPRENLTASVKDLNLGTPLWKYCLGLALLFLLAEILIIKLWGFNPFKRPKAAIV